MFSEPNQATDWVDSYVAVDLRCGRSSLNTRLSSRYIDSRCDWVYLFKGSVKQLVQQKNNYVRFKLSAIHHLSSSD